MREADEYLALGRYWSSFRFIWRMAAMGFGFLLHRVVYTEFFNL